MSPPRIRRLHWGRLGDESNGPAAGTLFALWPEPIDSDPCFQAAGFCVFEDSDEQWHAEFDQLAAHLAVTLTAAAGALVDAAPATAVAGCWPRVRRRTLDPVEHLVFAAKDDQWLPCRLEFGSPVAAVLTASNGHPIFWIWLGSELAMRWPEHLHRFAALLPVIETPLQWSCLR